MSMRRYSFVMVLAALLCCVSLAVAGDQDRDRDRLKDGSCQDDVIGSGTWKVVAAGQDRDRTRDQDRLKDGSCRG